MGHRENRGMGSECGHPGILLFSIWVHCLASSLCAASPLPTVLMSNVGFPFLLKPLELPEGRWAPGICEGQRRKNKSVFAERKLLPSVPLPNLPPGSPSGLDHA